ncbi:hypothetical protein [Pseudocnuella soli]|uniref:hypothetical protein n=1 Tax=Pseudocnuella soli TaxID=2502779 RepID=UPI0010490B76|nr:hypothetical protein [Pseudocnuella soli]
MKSVLPLIALAVFASSCSTAYKSGQTPDDVYFSPEPKPYVSAARSDNDYVQMDRENSRQYRNNNNRRQQQYSDPEAYYDDRYLRMKVRNRRMWSGLDYYYADPFAYRYMDPFFGGIGAYGAYSYWNPYMAWGYHYNPYYSPYNHVIISNPKSPVYSRPRTANLNVFNRPNAPVYSSPRQSNGKFYGNNGNSNNRSYSQPRDFGNDIRNTFGNNRSSSPTPTYSAPSRSTMSSGSSSSGSSSSGSSGGGSAPVRKF